MTLDSSSKYFHPHNLFIILCLLFPQTAQDFPFLRLQIKDFHIASFNYAKFKNSINAEQYKDRKSKCTLTASSMQQKACTQ